VRAGQLQQLDDARALWLAHTAVTRAEAEQSRLLLADRHVGDEPEELVTAEEWLAAARAADVAEDPHREITDADVADLADVDREPAAVAARDDRADVAMADGPVVETAVTDLREVAAGELRPFGEDVVQVPSADEVAEALDRASRSLLEIRAREIVDQHADDELRDADLARWHASDEREVAEDTAEVDAGVDAADDWGPDRAIDDDSIMCT
jgi:hypothetical protein